MPNFSPFTYTFTLTGDSAANDTAAGTGGINNPSGGTSYASSLPNGSGDTVNLAPPSTSGVDASSTFSTTVKPGDGEITTTETVTIGFHVTDTVFNEMFNAISTTLTAFSNAVWAGITDVASYGEQAATSFGGAIFRLFGGGSGSSHSSIAAPTSPMMLDQHSWIPQGVSQNLVQVHHT